MEYDVTFADKTEEKIIVITNGNYLHIRISVNESNFITGMEAYDITQRITPMYAGDKATESFMFGEDTISVTYTPPVE